MDTGGMDNRPGVRRILGILLLIFPLWLNNSSLLAETGRYRLLAHRGLAQTFDISQVEWDTNTAAVMDEPEHGYLENTLASMEAAYSFGADVVELDIQKTGDGKLAVFHDFDLSMRTDGTGPVSGYTMEELKRLDVGYGYTADGGRTYPFRGTGTGLMPELTEVLAAFPDRDLLIHMKDTDPETAVILWSYLEEFSPDRLDGISVYGNHQGLMYLREQNSSIRVLSMEYLKRALLKYELLGWTGYIPPEIHNLQIHIPIRYARLLWGWPHRFVDRMESVNSRVVLVAGDGKWSEGFDTRESLKEIPEGFRGYVWTNRIDVIAGESRL